jgi:hypothetical protein
MLFLRNLTNQLLLLVLLHVRRAITCTRAQEIRYPVILSSEEKEIAARVTQAFGQAVCGFDILRVQVCVLRRICMHFKDIQRSTSVYDYPEECESL